MSKHAYTLGCDCLRCAKECARRSAQSLANPQRGIWNTQKPKPRRSRKPAYGSQEWAETRGDDIPDYSGDY